MALNLCRVGIPICKILYIDENENKKKKNQDVLYLDSEDSQTRCEQYTSLQLDKHERFQFIPIESEAFQRTVCYAAGQSGSGKSYWIKEFVKQYHSIFPKRDIFLFSAKSEDKELDSLKYIKRINVTEELIDEGLIIEDLDKTLVIYDDTDTITNKAKKQFLTDLMNSILEVGRSRHISFIYTSHIICKGHQTKTILNEANCLTVFPRCIGNAALKYLLDAYFGLNKGQIEEIRGLKKSSRSVSLVKTYPNIIISERMIRVVEDD